MEQGQMLTKFFEVDSLLDLMLTEGFFYLLVTLLLFYVAKKVFDWLVPYKLDDELNKKDNKAVAVAFSGYMFGVGYILYSVVKGEPIFEHTIGIFLLKDVGITALWSLGGIFLLLVASFFNDKILFSKFDNTKELIEDRNVGTGAVECGGYIASAVIINAVLSGESTSLLTSIGLTVLYFLLGQMGFIIFGYIYQHLVPFNPHEEIEKDNVAAGVSFGLNLVAAGILLAGFIKYSDSLVGFILWIFIASFLLMSCHYIIDKIILPNAFLEEEIKRDQNWGVALIEGMSAIIVSFIINAAFFG